MSCRLMRVIDKEFLELDYYDKERIKSIVCGASCGGKCCDEYLTKDDNLDSIEE